MVKEKLSKYKDKWWKLTQKYLKGQIGMTYYKNKCRELRKKYLTIERKRK